MSGQGLRSGAGRAGIIAATILLTWAALLIGRLSRPLDVEVGEPAAQTFRAEEFIEVVDEEATLEAREAAARQVPTRFSIDEDTTISVMRQIEAFFAQVAQLAQPVPSQPPPEQPGGTVTVPPAEPAEGEETTTTSTTTAPAAEPRPVEEQVQILQEQYPGLQPETITTFVEIANDPETPNALSQLRDEAISIAERELSDGIRAGEELNAIRNDLRGGRYYIRVPFELPPELQATAQQAVADVLATFLDANETVDEEATERARREAAEEVPEETRSWSQGAPIVFQGQEITPVQLRALQEAGLLRQPNPLGVAALLAVVTVLVLVVAFYLNRFRPDFWVRPKRVVLFGVLIVLAALVARAVAVVLLPGWPLLGYMIPAAAFGFTVAVLFDARMAVLFAVAMGTLTGLATHEPEAITGSLGYATFALLSTLVPVPFVSAISSRGDFRKAVGLTALALAPMAGATAWLFHGSDAALAATGLGLANGILSGVLAQGMLPFFENLFDVTTTLTLLDLTDRNHPALQLLEEKALGTFNHALMVGTLADAGARAIGANPLLARAAAYFHDLGKTENPWFFIENQFGGINPHDSMPPEESADIIRQHVEDGVRLAAQFRIPAEVAEGVLAHHGTGLMRYFYHKALQRYGEEAVEADDYRHRGRRPRSKEMTILMLADAVEGACRAMVLHEEPTAEGIRRTIESVVEEKLADGQLDESKLTLGDLRAVKEAFASSLIGHYHQRIPYPGFPEDELVLEADRLRDRASERGKGADLTGS